VKQEKTEKNVAAEIFLPPKQHEEIDYIADESEEDAPVVGLNLMVKKDDSSNSTADQKGQRWSVFQSECKIKDKGVRHVLKPAQKCAIMAEVFPAVTKKKAPKIIPKTGTSLLQERENDVVMSDPLVAICVCNDATMAVANASETPISSFKSNAKLVSYVTEEKEETNIIADAHTIIGNDVHKKEATEHLLKPRTAFFQEREDDEDIAHQIITSINSEMKCHSTYILEGLGFGHRSCYNRISSPWEMMEEDLSLMRTWTLKCSWLHYFNID
ncbi:hypothetical protein EJB05_34563, partial [Eragrostis curvula]